jgi:hypothetical protein
MLFSIADLSYWQAKARRKFLLGQPELAAYFAHTDIGRLIDAVGVGIGFAAGDDARFLRGDEEATAKATLDLFLADRVPPSSR